jgi:predicted transcriptional regulator
VATLENIDGAVSRVQASSNKKRDRTKLVQEYLKGSVPFDNSEGKTLMQWRAEFVTRLRQREVWP